MSYHARITVPLCGPSATSDPATVAHRLQAALVADGHAATQPQDTVVQFTLNRWAVTPTFGRLYQVGGGTFTVVRRAARTEVVARVAPSYGMWRLLGPPLALAAVIVATGGALRLAGGVGLFVLLLSFGQWRSWVALRVPDYVRHALGRRVGEPSSTAVRGPAV